MSDVHAELIEEENRALEQPYPNRDDGTRLMQEFGLDRILDTRVAGNAGPHLRVPSPPWPKGKPDG